MKIKTPEEIKKGLECCRHEWVDHHWKTCDIACPYLAEGSYCKNVLHHDATAYIRQLEARVPRWVPVEERLPEKYVALKYEYSNDLLVYDGQNIRTAYYCHTTEVWHNAEDEDETVNVTHWMPLPEPPKEVHE